MRSCLERALKYLTKAATLWPRFNEIVYTQAKCHALVGQTQDAAQKLEILSDRDRRYFAKASQDGDFETFRAGVEAVFRRAAISPGPLARATQAKLGEVAEAVAWAKRSAPNSEEDLAAVESIERELPRARQSLPTLEVDIEELNERLGRMRAELDKIAQRSFQNNIDASQQGVAACEARKTVARLLLGG
jgi:soluble cytochrome b562